MKSSIEFYLLIVKLEFNGKLLHVFVFPDAILFILKPNVYLRNNAFRIQHNERPKYFGYLWVRKI